MNDSLTIWLEKLEEEKRIEEELARKREEEEAKKRSIEDEKRRLEEEKRRAEEAQRLMEESVSKINWFLNMIPFQFKLVTVLWFEFPKYVNLNILYHLVLIICF